MLWPATDASDLTGVIPRGSQLQTYSRGSHSLALSNAEIFCSAIAQRACAVILSVTPIGGVSYELQMGTSESA